MIRREISELLSYPHIASDQHGRFTLMFQNKSNIRYAQTKIDFFKYGSKNPLIFKGEGRLVKVLFFDKDSSIEALKRNASNPAFSMKKGFNHFLFALHITRFRMPGFSHISRRFSAISGTHRAQTIDLAITRRKQTFKVGVLSPSTKNLKPVGPRVQKLQLFLRRIISDFKQTFWNNA